MRILCLIAVGLACFAAPRPTPAAPEQVAAWIAVLSSNAPLKEKCDACNELARAGGADAVSALAALLGDEKLSHMARYALEPMTDPAAGAALREALGRLKGPNLVGVIMSVGVRRDAEAVDALGALLGDADADVAAAAARALGCIASKNAAAVLRKSLATAPPSTLPAVADACLRCAEGLKDSDLYKAISASTAPETIRLAGKRGEMLLAGQGGAKQILECMRSDDPLLFALALGVARDVPGDTLTRKLGDAVAGLPPVRQPAVIQLLGDRRDAAALPAVLAAARSQAPEMRLAAVHALAQLGAPSSVSVLVELTADAESAVAAASTAALSGFPEGPADAAIVELMNAPQTNARLVAVSLIGQRRLTKAVPALLRAAGVKDDPVSAASIKVLGDLAGPTEIEPLVEILKTSSHQQAAESALIAACTRRAASPGGSIVVRKATYGDLPSGAAADVTAKVTQLVKAGARAVEASNSLFGDPAGGIVKKLRVDYVVDGVAASQTVLEGAAITFPGGAMAPAAVDALCRALPVTPAEPKLALLRILRLSGDSRAIAAVREAAREADPVVHEGAVRILCDWPTAEALPDLREWARTAPDVKTKILALRGCIRLASQSDLPPADQLAVLGEAMRLADRDEERLMILPALGDLPPREALAIVTPCLTNAALKDAAGLVAAKLKAKMPAQPAGNAWIPLFNGKDLEGWRQQGAGIYRVEDGCLLGTQTNGQGGDLFTTNTWDNFELRVSYRMKWPGNSGIWFRDQYQFDILKYPKPAAFSGTLYRPGISQLFLFINADEALEQRDGWNDARIMANGDRLALWLNGHKIGECRDGTWARGRIGVQVHGGNDAKGMEIRIKSLELRPLAAGEWGN